MSSAPNTVNSKAEFVQFLAELRADLQHNPEAWENVTLGCFLEAMAAWAADSDGYYRRVGQSVPQDASWSFFADILAAARTYE